VTPPDHTRWLAVTDDVADGVIYAGLVLLLGLTCATRWLFAGIGSQPRVRRLVTAGAAAAVVGSVANLLLEGPRAANTGWGGVVRLVGFGSTIGSRYWWEVGLRIVLLVALAVTARLPRDRRTDAVWVAGAVLTIGAIVSTGHADAGSDVPLALVATGAHVASMCLWLGGLVCLFAVVLPTVRRTGWPAGDGLPMLRRWSAVAYGCVAVLIVSGEYQAARQITPLAALWSTRYGIVLLVKVGLVALMLASALLAQRQIRGATTTDGGVRRIVGRSVRAEAILAAAVIAATAILVNQPPAAASYGPAVHLSAPVGTDRLLVDVARTRPGPQDITVRVVDASGAPVKATSLDASLSSAGIAALTVTMRPDTTGSTWRSHLAVAPQAGYWTLTLDVGLDAASAYATSVTYYVW
jgi:copper transport protein